MGQGGQIARAHGLGTVTLLGWLIISASACVRDDEPLTVHAAASLTDVLPRVAEAWRSSSASKAASVPVRWSFGASSRLAKQIEAGAPGDAYFSADTAWMDYLGERERLLPGTRRVVLRNQLVLIVPRSSSDVRATDPLSLVRDPALHRLALAGESVPAGRYAKAALERAGVWDALQAEGSGKQIVRADDVRMALAWVARGEAEAGIVYATDAKAEPRVQVVYTFPADRHPPIRYTAAVLDDAKHPDAAKAFLDFCGSDEARTIFGAAGFEPASASVPAPHASRHPGAEAP